MQLEWIAEDFHRFVICIPSLFTVEYARTFIHSDLITNNPVWLAQWSSLQMEIILLQNGNSRHKQLKRCLYFIIAGNSRNSVKEATTRLLFIVHNNFISTNFGSACRKKCDQYYTGQWFYFLYTQGNQAGHKWSGSKQYIFQHVFMILFHSLTKLSSVATH